MAERAIEMMMEDHVIPNAFKNVADLCDSKYLFDRNMFRDEKLYFIEIDQVFRENYIGPSWAGISCKKAGTVLDPIRHQHHPLRPLHPLHPLRPLRPPRLLPHHLLRLLLTAPLDTGVR